MGPVVVLADDRARRPTYALLTLARRLGRPEVLLRGAVEPDTVAELGRYGAATVHRRPDPGATVDALVAIAARTPPVAILVAHDGDGAEVAARLAVRLDSGLVAGAIDVRPGPDGPVAVTVAGGCRVESGVTRGIPLFTVRTAAVVPEPDPVEPVVASLDVDVPRRPGAARLVSRSTRRADLASAAVVVAGGRGIGGPEAYELVDRLAGALGGAAGGSHTATELGYCPREGRIDQVGTVVHPKLYLALGVSGSVRHRAAMRDAATIVAVDRDPAAPIFGLADLAVVGDLHDVVPALIAEIDRRRTDPVRMEE